MLTTDLNCDMGEGMPYDALLMPLITSANIACGYHAGDDETMALTVALAKQHGVSIGAHPGFNDKENFGRTEIDLPAGEVYKLVAFQLCTLLTICNQLQVRLHHVKPHGALYNMAAINPAIAAAIARAVVDADPQLILYGLSGSFLISEAKKAGLATAAEVFADRTYQPDGTLTPRTWPNALITYTKAAIAQVLQMIQQQQVTCANGVTIPIVAQTICLHGDGEHAVAFATAINQKLRAQAIEIKST